MKAALFYGPGDLRIEEIGKPHLGPDDILLNIKQVGICGTDIHIYKGDVAVPKPLIMGHEFVGDVVHIGINVRNLKVGDKAVADHIIGCGNCFYCKKGQTNLCSNRGALGINLPGALAEYLSVPSHLVYVLPKSLTYDDGVLVEPLSIAVYALSKADIIKGQTVAIIGQGAIGILLDQVAKESVAKVIGIDIEKSRLNYAKQRNYIDFALNSSEKITPETIKNLISRDGVDIVIEAVGLGSTARLSLELASKGGRIILLGVFSQEVSLDMMQIVKKELEIFGSWTCHNTFSQAIKLLQERKIETDGFITHRYPLEKVKQAFEDMIKFPSGRIKTIIQID